MDLVQSRFDTLFPALTGASSPYPWQRELFQRFLSGDPPDALDIPTGLGKTSVIPIWLLALLLADPGRRPPMRLVYVVNRRTIVDQATSIAEGLWPGIKAAAGLKEFWIQRYGCSELAVSTLRGAKADNGDWLLVPHSPAIIIGTVDMIGSRLLFNAYRAGRWQRSRHAGLLGQDSLLVHDEAHLSEPFQQLLEWIAQKQKADASPEAARVVRPTRVLAMSATASSSADRVLTLGPADKQKTEVKTRVLARKTLYIHDAEKQPGAQLARLALNCADDRKRVIVYVRQPTTAGKIADELRKKVGHERVALLTGTIRGHERDQLINTPVLQRMLKSEQPSATEYLVSTSAGEVGADFDADHLVCDLTTIDSFIQRVGRVNRRGQGDARIDLVLDVKASDKDSAYERARLATAELLRKLPARNGGYDASPQALRELRAANESAYEEARSPRVATVRPHDAVLDAWSLTSIQEPWPLACDVAPYLHGLDDASPQTTLAWRAELDELATAETIDPVPIIEILTHYPLRPQEVLNERPDRAAELLLALRHRTPEKPLLLMRGASVEAKRLKELPEDPDQMLRRVRNRTVVLACTAGGLNPSTGMVDPGSELVPDVADIQHEQKRARVLLTREDDGAWHARQLAKSADMTGADGDGKTFSTADTARFTSALPRARPHLEAPGLMLKSGPSSPGETPLTQTANHGSQFRAPDNVPLGQRRARREGHRRTSRLTGQSSCPEPVPEATLKVPHGFGADVAKQPLIYPITPSIDFRHEQQLLLYIGRKMVQVHDLRHARLRDAR